MSNMDFLVKEQVFGEKRLCIFDDYGTSAQITDFAILSSEGRAGINFELMTSDWYTKSPDRWPGEICGVNCLGEKMLLFDSSIGVCLRPCLKYSEIKDNCIELENNGLKTKRVLYGEYPQTTVNDRNLFSHLQYVSKIGLAQKTGNVYTIDTSDRHDIVIHPASFEEYALADEKYVKVNRRFLRADELFHKEKVRDYSYVSTYNGNYENATYWLKVEPIEWLVDEENDVAIPKYLLNTGPSFCAWTIHDLGGYCAIEEFDHLPPRTFLDEYLSKEIIQNINLKNTKNKTYTKTKKEQQ